VLSMNAMLDPRMVAVRIQASRVSCGRLVPLERVRASSRGVRMAYR
jgi:hypothetical protein